jgi:hypothetical protein
MTRRPCLEPDCPALATPGQSRCPTHTRARRRTRPPTTGYGTRHQAIRRALLPGAYGQPCIRCGQPLQPGQPIELDHTDDRRGYAGFAHRWCNRSAGGQLGAARRWGTGGRS